jgi:hypothetical protein
VFTQFIDEFMRKIPNYVVDEVRRPAAAPEITDGRLKGMTF